MRGAQERVRAEGGTVSSLLPPSHATALRSLAKTCTWRLVASLDTFVLSYLITGRLMYAGSIAGAEVFTKMLLYYVHERGWAHVTWGFKPVKNI
jgi:uncharacterized membrane protein